MNRIGNKREVRREEERRGEKRRGEGMSEDVELTSVRSYVLL